MGNKFLDQGSCSVSKFKSYKFIDVYEDLDDPNLGSDTILRVF